MTIAAETLFAAATRCAVAAGSTALAASPQLTLIEESDETIFDSAPAFVAYREDGGRLDEAFTRIKKSLP